MSNSPFLALAAFVVLSSAALGADPATSTADVSGQGLVRAVPDRVVIDITVTTTDDDLIRVRNSSDQDARTILTIGKKHGVDDSGFEVSRLELSLDYNEKLRRQIYQVERDVTLSLGDLTKLDAILSELLRERNLKIGGINFLTSKARQHEIEARSLAVADARKKAAHLAELTGLQLGKAIEIRIVDEDQRPFVTSVIPVIGSAEPRGRRGLKHGSTQLVQDVPTNSSLQFVAFQKAKDGAQAGDRPFALGMIEITAEVDIVFELTE